MVGKPFASYRNTRTGAILDQMPTLKGGFYWRERNYKGLFAYGATFDFSQSRLDRDIAAGILEAFYD